MTDLFENNFRAADEFTSRFRTRTAIDRQTWECHCTISCLTARPPRGDTLTPVFTFPPCRSNGTPRRSFRRVSAHFPNERVNGAGGWMSEHGANNWPRIQLRNWQG